MNFQIYDKYIVDDEFNKFLELQKKDVVGPRGYVRLIQNKKPITSFMPNLVVAPGRRFVAQRLFNNHYPSDIDTTSYSITHFGIGSGGSYIDNGIVTLNGPEMCDQDLYNSIQFDTTSNLDYLTSPGDTSTSQIDYVCKRIESDGSIEFVENTNINCYDEWYTWVKCTCVKAAGEPNQLDVGESVRIDEAALFYTNYPQSYQIVPTAYMFSHICFPPKWVEKETEFVIEWYILC